MSEVQTLKRSAGVDAWLWPIAFSPLAWFGMDALSGLTLVFALIVIGLCALDIQQLRKAGLNSPSIWWSLLTPGYLYNRSRRTGGNQAPLVVWVVLTLAPLIHLPQ